MLRFLLGAIAVASLAGAVVAGYFAGWLDPADDGMRSGAVSQTQAAGRPSVGKEPHAHVHPANEAQPTPMNHAGHHGMAIPSMPGMEMPSAKGQASAMPGLAVVQTTPQLQQRIGVTVGQAEKAPLKMQVSTVGIVQPNETRVARIHLRTEGWIKTLSVNFTGMTVNKGDPLLSIYSPQFLSTQQEYLQALESNQQPLADLARNRLELWGVPPETIDQLRQSRKPQTNLTLRSPMTGTVLEKNAFEDQYVTPSKELYVVADLSTVWVQAKVYEYELPHVELGQPATVTVPSIPSRSFVGKVVFIQPIVEEPARTIQVRVQLPNAEGQFKPGMFTNITITHTMGEGLLVPFAAVIRTGTRDYVFRAEADNRFVPNEVVLDDYLYEHQFHVLKGLKAGDRVVTSANFLIDSESRLEFGGGGMQHMPGMPGMEHSHEGH